MQRLVKNILISLAIFIVLSLIFGILVSPYSKPQEISLSQLAEKINQEQVKSILVSGNNLEIILKDNSKAISQKETEASLTESLKNYNVNPQKLSTVDIGIKKESSWSSWLGVILPFLIPLIIIGVFLWFMMRQAQHGAMQAFSFGQANVRPASQKEKKTFADVAGLNEAKEELKEIVDFLKNPKKFLNMGARIPRGVLLMGPPGTGKTLLAKAVAGEAGVPFLFLSGSEFVEMFVGVGASRARDLFKTAKKQAPSIVFIDEIDAVGRHRGAGVGGGHDEREQTLNQILVEMDGFDRDTNVIVIAATNRPDILDPALLRPGRFDRRVVLDLPDINDREAILKIHSKEKPFAPDVNLRRVAERTPGFSGADLANLMNEAAILAAHRNKKVVNQMELLESIEKVILGPERKSNILSVREKEIAAYHEAGHAVVTRFSPEADPVHKISIISRGMAAGYTLKLPTEDKHLHSKTEFLSDIAVSMGGYCAEKLIFNEITTGASNDLQKAASLARQMVLIYGMSDKFGPVAFGEHSAMVFLGKEINEERNYSDKVAAQIDEEIKKILDKSYLNAKKILTQHKSKLEKIAKILIEKETIEKEEFEKLMK
ncbi:MAG: ATP-dependent zinc metalloprotease FtsH [candidate division CPR1 bacterium GW2011_GWA2_42_17]|uniref:ATP-dependent zinc metalloprotease FtsH n=1 Tax=candidate division CPR1 bacterium GW2011_GWA2_42_17 TaxID=1618341 RepID=A0A0G0Z3G7_9BACT|nr:MAG: ATP-dependent zinc metalloprotease FtsH [candidate division CPR1 bacterium GW2011_GWA2_42_17]